MEVKFIKWDRGLGCACSVGHSNRYMTSSKHDGKVLCSFLSNYEMTNDQHCNLYFLTWTFKSLLLECIVYQHYL